ncbi:serine hydrolase domain-containing protein [Lacibacter sediminis]|uniref:Beta-lactamase family protein n=1 Tax=Lacibacter sediminis TaxID=2760713 RepID=A0A7G5XM55_9BACT|nr:serine hydrolase domain-containing protein [Lacibacter sediminis]QNA46558.1 beta-lactamase family protein [Lacibacter sediminis]
MMDQTFFNFKQFLVKGLSVGCLFFSVARNAQSGSYNRAARQTDSLMRAKMEELHIPGAAVAVIQNGKLLQQSVYGLANLEWGNAITVNSNFQSASCTKLLTSTLYLKAVHHQKICPEDLLCVYLEDVPEGWRNIRIKHLINHSSGIKEFIGDPNLSSVAWLKAVQDSVLNFEPGSKQQYTQSDFALLAVILEQLYRQPFDQLLQNEILYPLGMQDGSYDAELRQPAFTNSNLVKEKVSTYYFNDVFRLYKFLYPFYNYAAGGFYASISDWTKWAISLDTEVLFPVSLLNNSSHFPNTVDKPFFSNAGWLRQQVQGHTITGHTGGPGLSEVWRFTEAGFTFIVLTNDTELLPGLALQIASFYLPGFSAPETISKFKRSIK